VNRIPPNFAENDQHSVALQWLRKCGMGKESKDNFKKVWKRKGPRPPRRRVVRRQRGDCASRRRQSERALLKVVLGRVSRSYPNFFQKGRGIWLTYPRERESLSA
jgi:hypothetical protein